MLVQTEFNTMKDVGGPDVYGDMELLDYATADKITICGVNLTAGEITLVAGFTGAGKSLLGLNVAYHSARAGYKTLYADLENGPRCTKARWLAFKAEHTPNLAFTNKSDLDYILGVMEEWDAKVLVIDQLSMLIAKAKDIYVAANEAIETLRRWLQKHPDKSIMLLIQSNRQGMRDVREGELPDSSGIGTTLFAPQSASTVYFVLGKAQNPMYLEVAVLKDRNGWYAERVPFKQLIKVFGTESKIADGNENNIQQGVQEDKAPNPSRVRFSSTPYRRPIKK